jgi:FKBP-type peptidyl-prolyl cis-trans isomerase FklB
MISKTSSLFSIRTLSLAALVSSGLLLSACTKADTESSAPSESTATGELKTAEQKVSYAIGYNIGSDMASKPGLEIDHGAITGGLIDALNMSESKVTQEEIQTAFVAVQKRMAEKLEAEGEIKMAEEAEFLAENITREGVIETASGLQYEVLKSGTGSDEKPKETDTVSVHYHGTLMDGSVFDSSVNRGMPVAFPVNRVVPGWTEALQLMSVGDKWKLYLPASLGYGAQATEKIPAFSLLVFEVEILQINPSKPEIPKPVIRQVEETQAEAAQAE